MQTVQGEIYEVDDQVLDYCDRFEEHPPVYQRTDIPVRVTSSK